jgi:hypothetical protein
MRDALILGDLSRARTACDQAAALLARNRSDLAPYARSFRTLRQRLTQAEELVTRVSKIELLLQRAHELAAEKVTQARECEARAKFLAWRTPLKKEEAERLDQLVRKLQPKLQLAHGRRAVQQAEACVAQGGAATRDLLVAEARNTLPGLPESQILDLLNRVNQVAKASAAGQDDSEFAQAVMFRRQYERSLDHFGSGRLMPAVEAAVEALKTSSALERTDRETCRQKLADVVFLVLESMGAECTAGEGDQEQATRLLKAAHPFAEDPRWAACESQIVETSE